MLNITVKFLGSDIINNLEIWKPIENYENYYLISNYGNVKSLITNKILIGDKNSLGYRRVTLYVPQKKRFFIHYLVAKHFCKGYQAELIVNHIDGNKLNNYYKNLEWVTHSQNDLHAFKNNLRSVNGNKNVTKYEISTNKVLKTYNSITDATKNNDLSLAEISRICNKLCKCPIKNVSFKFT